MKQEEGSARRPQGNGSWLSREGQRKWTRGNGPFLTLDIVMSHYETQDFCSCLVAIRGTGLRTKSMMAVEQRVPELLVTQCQPYTLPLDFLPREITNVLIC